MVEQRWLRFLAGAELGLSSTAIFVGLYTWPFLTFDKPSVTFRFIFVVWVLHIALIAATSYARRRIEDGAGAAASDGDER
jgi:hypothetical protein